MRLARQLWVLLVVPTALALFAYGAFAHQNRQRALRAEASTELKNYATLVEASLGPAIARGQPAALRERLDGLARADRIVGFVAFEEQQGAILATAEVVRDEAEITTLARRALREGAEVEEELALAGGRALARTITLPSPSGARIVVVVVRDLQYVSTFASVLDRGLVFTGVVVLALIGLVAGWVTRNRVAVPVSGLVRGAERIASGDLS
jgi:methyl-accepting chemotaxis protein